MAYQHEAGNAPPPRNEGGAGTEGAAPLPRVSVILFCSQSAEHTPQILEELLAYLAPRAHDHELVLALDGHLGGLHARFGERIAGIPWVRIVRLHAAMGQIATIRAGAAVARGQLLVTYPSYPQVRPEAIDDVVRSLERDEYVVGYRQGRRGSPFNRVASRVFNALIDWTTGTRFHDLACGLHGMRAYVASAISGYGQNQLFLPILLAREGFRVGEVGVPAAASGPGLRLFGPATFGRRGLDLLTLAYLVRFTQKPLRPFGALGLILVFVGLVLGGVLAYQRLFLGSALAERPMLLLALLFLTAGIQVVILGFLGELLLYLHFRDQVHYRIAEWFQGEEGEIRVAGAEGAAEAASGTVQVAPAAAAPPGTNAATSVPAGSVPPGSPLPTSSGPPTTLPLTDAGRTRAAGGERIRGVARSGSSPT